MRREQHCDGAGVALGAASVGCCAHVWRHGRKRRTARLPCLGRRESGCEFGQTFMESSEKDMGWCPVSVLEFSVAWFLSSGSGRDVNGASRHDLFLLRKA